MSKLTPPAPQNLNKRLKFFLDHPEYPRAAEHIKVCKALLRARGRKRKDAVADVETEVIRQADVPELNGETMPKPKATVLQRITGFFRRTP